MGTEAVVIGDVCGKHAPEMPIVEDDDMIEHLATDTPDEPLAVGVLPRTARVVYDLFREFSALASTQSLLLGRFSPGDHIPQYVASRFTL